MNLTNDYTNFMFEDTVKYNKDLNSKVQMKFSVFFVIVIIFIISTVIDSFRQKYFIRAPFSQIDDNETCFIY